MSYCRWSSDFGECDVYVYEHVGGYWAIHVAGRKLKHRVPDQIRMLFEIPDTAADYGERYVAAMKAEREWRESLPCDEVPCKQRHSDGTVTDGVYRTPKDSEYYDLDAVGPEAGESFAAATPGECADLLEALKAKGFRVPDYAIRELRAEQVEIDRETPPVELHYKPTFIERLLGWLFARVVR